MPTGMGVAQFERFFRVAASLDIDKADIGRRPHTQLHDLVGGLRVALTRAFKIIDPNVKNPQTLQWERTFRVFNLLL